MKRENDIKMRRTLICILALCLSVLSLLGIGTSSKMVNASSNQHTVTFNYNANRVLSYLPDNEAIRNSLTSYAVDVEHGSTAIETNRPSGLINPYYNYEWTLDGETPVDISSYAITEDTQFIAKWTTKKYYITFDYSGLEDEITNIQTSLIYNVESPRITLYKPERANYSFVGWYTNLNDSSTRVYATNPRSVGDKTLYAKFAPIEYYITYNTDAIHENISSYNVEDENIPLYAPYKEGHLFRGWYLDKSYTQRVTEIDCSKGGNLNIYAKWELQTYEVTYILPNGITKVVETEYGHTAELPKTQKSIFEVVKTNVSRKNITEDTTIEIKIVNIWYVYFIGLILIAGLVVAIVFIAKNRRNAHNTLRQIYHSSANGKRKY